MKFTILMQEFIDFLETKNFNFNINKRELYNENKQRNNKLFSSNNTNKQLDNVLGKLYVDFVEAYSYLQKAKSEKKIFDMDIQNIDNVNQIPLSEDLFGSSYMPKNIVDIIKNESDYYISYKFKIKDRNIKIIFVTCGEEIIFGIDKYNNYMENIFIWFYIASQHAYKYCSKNLTVYIYFTNNKRLLPSSSVQIIDANNVNGGISNICVKNSLSEIVIYRKEEWFKVLIHETFHNYGLDFSDLVINSIKNDFRKLFPVKSNMEVFESYTEFWAEIINICFICFLTIENMPKENSRQKFLQLTRELINIERCFSMFQCCKILSFMGLEYEDLFLNNKLSKIKRDNLYKEKTNIFPYYVVKCILMYYCEDFLIFCNENNTSLLRFNKTTNNLHNYFMFVKEKHNNQLLLEDMKKMNKYFIHLSKNEIHHCIQNTLRMSISETN